MSGNEMDKLFSEFEEKEEVVPGKKEEVEAKLKPQEEVKPKPEEVVAPKKEEETKPPEEGAVATAEELLGVKTKEKEKLEVKKSVEKPVPQEEGKYDTSDAPPTIKRTHMIYGEKGEGKTNLAFSFTGRIYCLSFDRKSIDVWENMYGKDPRIKVKDGIRYLSKMSPEMWLKSADVSFRYVMQLLETDAKEFQPDWIVIDGLEMVVRDICEKRMRYMNNVSPFGGVQLTLWQERNMYVDQINKTSEDIAKKGVIYTAYVNVKSIKIVDEKLVETKREPSWAADVKTYTDVVIRVEAVDGDKGREFYAYVESSKTNDMRTGVKVLIGTSANPKAGVHGYNKILEASKIA